MTTTRADLALGAVQIDHLDAVVEGVHPVEDSLWDVQTQAVGPQHRFTGQEHIPVGAVHPGTLYSASFALLRVLLPVCPVHPPKERRKKKNGFFYNESARGIVGTRMKC